MPNLTTHIAAAWLLARPIRSIGPWAFLFALGAVIPDISPGIYVPLLDVFRFGLRDPQSMIWFFQPWHTPFGSLILCAAVSFLFAGRPFAVFGSLAAGTMSHFFLDIFQKHIGMHTLLLYPFSFVKITPSLFFSDHPVFQVLTLVSLSLIAVFFWKFRKDLQPVRFVASVPRVLCAVVFFTIAIVIPFLTRDAFYRNDYHSLQFFRDPPSREGKPLAICTARVTGNNPWKVMELGRSIVFVPPPEIKVAVGNLISFKGPYLDGIVRITDWHIHRGLGVKIAFSLLGLVILAMMLIVPVIEGGRHAVSKD